VVPERRDELRDLLARSLTAPSLATALVVGVLGALSDLPLPIIDLGLIFAALLALAGTYFNVVDHVARGKPGFPAPAEADGWSPRTLATRGLICLFVVLVPFGVWLAVNPGAQDTGELVAAHPVTAVVLAALGQAWLTAAVLAVLASVSGLAAFWPPALVAVVSRAPAVYLRLASEVAASTAATFALVRLAALVTGRTPYLSSFVMGAVASLALFAQAALVGGFVHRHRELYSVR
jgi:hypothetical protein